MKFLTALLVLISAQVFAVEIGETAPNFTLDGTKDHVSLSDYHGKIVVLEWLNHGCPFIRKHYDSKNMQTLQRKYTAKDIVWLSIISSAPGKQGHVDKKGVEKEMKENDSGATHVLLDPTGKVGKLYEAKTTPHMYIISQKGELVYQGAIDNRPDADQDSIASAKNYVAEALDQLLSKQKIKVAKTKAYGCQVKYQ